MQDRLERAIHNSEAKRAQLQKNEEALDELSKDTIRSYMKKAIHSAADAWNSPSSNPKKDQTIKKRQDGHATAVKKMGRRYIDSTSFNSVPGHQKEDISDHLSALDDTRKQDHNRPRPVEDPNAKTNARHHFNMYSFHKSRAARTTGDDKKFHTSQANMHYYRYKKHSLRLDND